MVKKILKIRYSVTYKNSDMLYPTDATIDFSKIISSLFNSSIVVRIKKQHHNYQNSKT